MVHVNGKDNNFRKCLPSKDLFNVEDLNRRGKKVYDSTKITLKFEN